MEQKRLELIYILPMIIVPIIVLVWLTASGQIFPEPDAYYWLVYSELGKPWMANLLAGCMWFSMFILFSMVSDRKQNPYFIASLFLLNLFSLRYFALEMKDFLMTIFGFLVILWFKNNPVSFRGFRIDHKYVGLLMSLFYIFPLHMGLVFGYPAGDVHIEGVRDLSVLFVIAPALLLMGMRYRWSMVVALLALVFMTPKFVYSGLPFLIFSVYLDFVSAPEFSIKRTFQYTFLIIFIMKLLVFTITNVNANVQAFQDYCITNGTQVFDPAANTTLKVCNFPNMTEFDHGHYFSWRSYVANDTLEFGSCRCVGKNCLPPIKIVCGV